MDDKIRTALDEIPEKSRSKLEPHADVIRDLRRKGRTYEEIAEFFAERLNLKVAPSTIHAFVRVRARRHHRLRIELPPGATDTIDRRGRAATEMDVKRRIERLKKRPQPTGSERLRFHYDESQPLELVRKK